MCEMWNLRLYWKRYTVQGFGSLLVAPILAGNFYLECPQGLDQEDKPRLLSSRNV